MNNVNRKYESYKQGWKSIVKTQEGRRQKKIQEGQRKRPKNSKEKTKK